jgi:hypothetical protein
MTSIHGAAATKKEPVKLDEQQVAALGERLCRPIKRPVPTDGHLLAQKTVIPQEALDKQITRLYDQALETRNRKLAAIHAQETKPLFEARTLTQEELDASVARQYTQALETSKNKRTALAKKFQFEPPAAGSLHRSRSKGPHGAAAAEESGPVDVKALAKRLHDDSRQHKDEQMQKLYAEYIDKTGPKRFVMAPEEAAAAGARLSANQKRMD